MGLDRLRELLPQVREQQPMVFLIFIVVVIVLLSVIAGRTRQRRPPMHYRQCPHCLERIHPQASRCRYCHGTVERLLTLRERIWQKPTPRVEILPPEKW
jgi:hypothetical protein